MSDLIKRQQKFIEWLKEKGMYNAMEAADDMQRMFHVWEAANNELFQTIENLLEALDAPFPDSCDCGGSPICAVCNAYRTLKRLK